MNNDNMFWTGGRWVAKEKEERPHRAKIIDAHYHIFPKLGSQKEGIDPALRTRFWQYHSREFNNWWRVDTGEKVDQQFLEFKSNNLADMPNVNFRLIDYGKARITIDKIDYDMQFYTPSLINNELPPERGVGEMNLAGVDIGILQADHVYGDLADFYGKAMRDYPDRFIGLAQIWEPEANNEVRLAKLERSIVEQCNKGLYFSVESLTGAMKNAFGGLLNHKRHWTHSVIHETLVDLLKIQKEIHPEILAVTDATFAGDGPGPRAMQWHIKNLILVSKDQVAIDAVCAHLMGFDPFSIKFIKLAHDEGLGCGDINKIQIVGDSINNEKWNFNSGMDTLASKGQKLIYWGPLKRLEKILLQSPIVPWSFWASNFYYNTYWMQFIGKKRVNLAMKTEWGELFKQY